MANKKGNPDIAKHGFKKGKEWKGNAKGAPKKLPRLKALMEAMLGGKDEQDITKTPIAKVVQALIDETTNKQMGAQRTQAAKEILERAFGKSKPVNDIEQEEPIQWNETKTYETQDKKKGDK